jgi:Phytanoyl-CoA dioxygenase (PhyH)
VLTTRDQVPDFGGPWFLSPLFEQMLSERKLDAESEQQVRTFAERGYLIVDDLGFADFEALAAEIAADIEPLHENGKYNRVREAWTVSPAVRRLATAPRILELLELLYGRGPIPFQTLNFWRGSQQATHSDAYHFHSLPKHFVAGVWVAFEDVDDGNGPLHYYPGSHRLPDYDFLDDEDDLKPFVDDLISAYGLVKENGYLKRGQGLIWAANLLHGGDPVADTSRTRRSQVTHFYFEDCSYYTPFRSDPNRGKYYFRQITDVRTGKLRPLRVDGKRVHPPVLSRAVTWNLRLRRALGRGYVRHAM